MRPVTRFTIVLLPLLFLLLLSACDDTSADPPPAADESCAGFFGAPNDNTGLDSESCFPWIEGQTSWEAKVWNEADLAALLLWELENPPQVLTSNPYEATPDLQPDETAVCAVIKTGERRYSLETFSEGSVTASVEAAQAARGVVTHGGACGACSSLADLHAYARTPDQTEPVRACTASHLTDPVEELDACIQEAVGFTPPCARIWAYNGINDGEHCREPCFISLVQRDPYNQEDGTLNPCLACDESTSGPVFKAVAGRTRRNSGLAAAICRPCDTVWRIDHAY